MATSLGNYNTPYDLNPLSYGSIIIGIISFTFTLLTLLRVTWGNIVGLWVAPDEIRYTFANLKSALHEERAHCRTAWNLIRTQVEYEREQDREDTKRRRRHSGSRAHGHGQHRKHRSGNGKGASAPAYSPTLAEAGVVGSDAEADGQGRFVVRTMDQAANWKVLYGSVRRLCRQFSELERPFLKQSVLERQQRAEQVRIQAAAAEKGGSAFSDVDSDEDPGLAYDEAEVSIVRGRHGHYMVDDYLRDYVSFDLSHRFMWLRKQSYVDGIGRRLQEVQIRRSSAETTQILRSVCTIEAGLRDLRLIQDQRDDGRRRPSQHRREGERWERVHVRRSAVQDD